jgi:hypothetical protein
MNVDVDVALTQQCCVADEHARIDVSMWQNVAQNPPPGLMEPSPANSETIPERRF